MGNEKGDRETRKEDEELFFLFVEGNMKLGSFFPADADLSLELFDQDVDYLQADRAGVSQVKVLGQAYAVVL